MPEITRFYGIVIKMYFRDEEHEPSRVHAIYGDCMGDFNVETTEMIEGDLPVKGQELVREWLVLHQSELREMWDSRRVWKLPPL